jgi:hypothetical protein
MTKPTQNILTIFMIGLAVVALIFGFGWIVSGVFINIQERGCGLLEAGIGQFSGQQEDALQPQTEAECLKVVKAATPAYRIWGVLFSCILSGGALLTIVALVSILGRRSNAPPKSVSS